VALEVFRQDAAMASKDADLARAREEIKQNSSTYTRHSLFRRIHANFSSFRFERQWSRKPLRLSSGSTTVRKGPPLEALSGWSTSLSSNSCVFFGGHTYFILSTACPFRTLPNPIVSLETASALLGGLDKCLEWPCPKKCEISVWGGVR